MGKRQSWQGFKELMFELRLRMLRDNVLLVEGVKKANMCLLADLRRTAGVWDGNSSLYRRGD